MLHHLPVTLISSVAGLNNDGFVIGSVAESPLIARYSSLHFASNTKVYRLDRAGNSLNIIDDTTNALSGTSNAFSPFGTNNVGISAILKIYDSIDGVWASNPLTLSLGSINDLKSTGWKKILFGETARVAWKPTADPLANVPSKKYVRVELDDAGDKDSFILAADEDIQGILINVTQAGSATQPVKLSEVKLIRRTSEVKYRNETTDANGSASYTPAEDTYFPAVNREDVIIVSNPHIALIDYVHRKKGANVETVVVEYYSSNQWKTLTYTSASNHNNSGSATTQATATRFASTYDLPDDATSNAFIFATASGNETITGYALRFRTTAISAEGAINAPIVRNRIKQFGNSNTEGMTSLSAEVLKGICIRGIGVHSGNATVIKLINMTTGVGRSLTIPANPTFPFTVDFDDITFPLGDKIGLAHVSGSGVITNLDIYLIQ